MPAGGWLGSGLSGGSVAAGGCRRRAGGILLCGGLRRWLEPSLLNGAAAERSGFDRFSISSSLLVLQPFHHHADIDGHVFHLAQGGFADITAFEIDVGGQAHL